MLLSFTKILSLALQNANTFLSTSLMSAIPNLALLSVAGYSFYSLYKDIKSYKNNSTISKQIRQENLNFNPCRNMRNIYEDVSLLIINKMEQIN